MKYTILTCMLAMSLFASVESSAQVFADPGVSGLEITNNLLVPQDANQLFANANYILRVPIFNSNQVNAIPQGTVKLKIGIGTKAVPSNTAVPSTSFTSFFAWTATFTGGQWLVEGANFAPIPADFTGTVEVPITCNNVASQASSTFTVNFSVSNHAPLPGQTLSDEDPTNNTATLSYTVIPPSPVKFTSLDLLKAGCNIKTSFNIEEELNVDHYEIEASKDGINFVKTGTVTANNLHTYKTDFVLTDAIRAEKIFVRIKAVDKDGHIQYSNAKAVSGICGQALQIQLYPNPVTDHKAVVNAVQGLFNGRYRVSVRDFAGKLISIKELDLNNTARFDYELGNIASGKYLMQVADGEGAVLAVLQMQKL